MKAGWTFKRLEELAEIRLGRTPPRAEKKFWDPIKATDNTWVSIADLSANEGGIITESKEHLSKAGADSTPLVKAGTLLVSFKLSLGKVAIAGKDLRTNEAIAAMPIKVSGLDINWLKYFFQFFDWDKAAVGEEKVKGKALNKEKLKEIEIPLPSMAEQKRIVALLDEAFAGIDEAKAKAEANMTLALATLSSFLDKEFNAENSELSPIGDIFTTMTGTTPPKNEASYYGKDVLFVKPPELRGGLISETEDGLTKEGAAVARIAPRNSILVSCIGILGKVGWADKPVAFNQQINAILPREDHAHWKYMLFQMKSPKFRKSLTEASTGTTVYMVNKSRFNQLMVRLPSLKHQAAAAERFTEIDQLQSELTSNLNKRKEALNSLKESLLAQAFAGELTA
jgi:type I restriction enzyme S subunit